MRIQILKGGAVFAKVPERGGSHGRYTGTKVGEAGGMIETEEGGGGRSKRLEDRGGGGSGLAVLQCEGHASQNVEGRVILTIHLFKRYKNGLRAEEEFSFVAGIPTASGICLPRQG